MNEQLTELTTSYVVQTMRSSRRAQLLILLLISACSEACSEASGPVELSPNAAGRIVVSFGASIQAMKRDRYGIESARVADDTLHVRVSHGGGCATHEYGLIAYNGWLESNPVQVGAMVLHDGHGDTCLALIHKDLRYDLQPLRAAYAESYRTTHGTIIIRLSNPASPSASPLSSLTYTF